jgi:transposase
MRGANHPDLTNLLERVARLEVELSRTKDELALANAEIKRKNQIIAGLQHRLFGSSSEKLDPNQLELLFNELIMGKPGPVDAAGDDLAKAKTRAASTRRTKQDRFPKNLKIIVEEVIIPEVVAADPDLYDEICEEYHDELDVIKPQMCWRRKILKKFALKNDKSRPPVSAPAPLASIPGTLIAAALAAQIAVDRFVDHLPYYRQSNRFDRLYGADIGRQTLNTWIHATARHLTPIGAAIRGEVRQAVELVIDETPHDYLCPGHGKTKRGYLWVFYDPVGRNSLFEWHAGRGHECLLDFLGYDPATKTISFTGTVQCDGYSAYRAIAALFGCILLAGCLAHIRRKFVEAMPEKPELILPILLAIQQIYVIEKQLREGNVPPACRELVRRTRSRAIADKLHELIVEARTETLPHGKFGEALTYAINQWDKFLVCLQQGTLEVDTNLVENLIRPTKLGARNSMFFGSLEAGTNNALFYTLMANCKSHGMDPEMYLTEVIKRLPHNATVEQAAELTPARFAAALAAAAQEVA